MAERIVKGIASPLVVAALVACSDRFVTSPTECSQRNPRPIVQLSPKERLRGTLQFVDGYAWLVTVDRYAAPREAGEPLPDAYPLDWRTDRVTGCEPPETLGDPFLAVYRRHPDGPIVGSSPDTSNILFDDDGYPWKTLPGDNARLVQHDQGDVLASDGTDLYRWNPARPPETRQILIHDVEGWPWSQVYSTDGLPEFFVQRAPDRLAVTDYVRGEVHPFADFVEPLNLFVLPGGRYAWDMNFDEIGFAIRLLDATLRREILLSEDGIHVAMHGTTRRGLLLVSQGYLEGCESTLFLSFPSLEIHEEPGCIHAASNLDETGLYLRDEAATYRYELATGRTTKVLSRPAEVTTDGDWSYLVEKTYTEDQSPPQVGLSRLPRGKFDAAPERLLDEVLVWSPLRLRNGHWLFGRATSYGSPVEIIVLNPDNGERSTLTSRANSHWLHTIKHSPLGVGDPNGEIGEALYEEVERDGSATWWVYRVPDDKGD